MDIFSIARREFFYFLFICDGDHHAYCGNGARLGALLDPEEIPYTSYASGYLVLLVPEREQNCLELEYFPFDQQSSTQTAILADSPLEICTPKIHQCNSRTNAHDVMKQKCWESTTLSFLHAFLALELRQD